VILVLPAPPSTLANIPNMANISPHGERLAKLAKLGCSERRDVDTPLSTLANIPNMANISPYRRKLAKVAKLGCSERRDVDVTMTMAVAFLRPRQADSTIAIMINAAVSPNAKVTGSWRLQLPPSPIMVAEGINEH